MISAARAFTRARTRTFWGLLIGYAAFYLCRNNLSAAAKILEIGHHVDKATFGQIASIGTLCYAIGKVVAGPVADRIGGRRVFFFGLYASAIANLFIGIGGPLWLFIVLWGLSRAFQSLGWAGLVQIMPRWFQASRYGTAMGAISTSYQFGGVFTPMILAGVLSITSGWQALFWAPAALLIAIGEMVRGLVVQTPADVGLDELPAEEPEPVVAEIKPPWHAPMRALLKRPAFWNVLGLSFALTIVRETFNLWMPRYFSDLGAGDAAAVFKSTAFPLLGLAGTLLAGWFSDRFSNGRRGPIIAVLLTCLVLSLLALANLPAVASHLGVAAATLAVPLTGLAGFCLLGPYSMVGGGVIALDFGGRHAAATAAGLLDGIGYLGASLAGVGVAAIVDHSGWAGAWNALAAMGALAVVLSVPLWRK